MRQHTTPLILQNGIAHRAEQFDLSSREYNEKWLQKIIQDNPTILPIEEIEPAFSSHVPICTELPTESGFCDNIFLNEDGYITLVECKLWRNPEARRKAVSQIIEYAKDLSRWSFSQFEENCLRASGNTHESILSII